MTDPFARATATTAHQRATTALERVSQLEQRVDELARELAHQLERRRQHVNPNGRCRICGHPCPTQHHTCRAHRWAEGP